jgi:hypothetical protein
LAIRLIFRELAMPALLSTFPNNRIQITFRRKKAICRANRNSCNPGWGGVSEPDRPKSPDATSDAVRRNEAIELPGIETTPRSSVNSRVLEIAE